MKTLRLKYHFLALAIVVVWGVSFVNTKVLLDHDLTPTEIFVYRFVVAYVGMLGLSRFRLTVRPWRDELKMMLLGLLSGTAYFILENTALKLTLVSDVAILTSLNSLITTLLAAIILKEECFTWVKLAGSIIAFGGVGLLTFYNGFVWGDGLLGDILAMLAAVAWAVYTIILKRIYQHYSMVEITRKTFFYGLIGAIPFMMLQPATPLSGLTEPVVLSNLLYLSLICSMLAFFVWGRVTVEIGAISSANYLYLSPVVSVIAAWFIYDERIGTVGLVGCVLVILGIILVERH